MTVWLAVPKDLDPGYISVHSNLASAVDSVLDLVRREDPVRVQAHDYIEGLTEAAGSIVVADYVIVERDIES